jgi:hypothetical protein
LVPKSKLEALYNRCKADFFGAFWDHETASLQSLGIHPLQWLLDFEPEAINPTIPVVDALKATEVGAYFNRVG